MATPLGGSVSTSVRSKSGHFTCSRERTDHVLPTLLTGRGEGTIPIATTPPWGTKLYPNALSGGAPHGGHTSRTAQGRGSPRRGRRAAAGAPARGAGPDHPEEGVRHCPAGRHLQARPSLQHGVPGTPTPLR